MDEPESWNYKPAQRIFEEWLRDTVVQLGYPDPLLLSSAKTANRSHNRIKTHELQKLARIISTHLPPITMPSQKLRILEFVVARRQAAQRACSRRPDQAESNESHAHFTTALQEIHTLLLPLEETRRVQQSNPKPRVTMHIPNHANVFDQLYLEDAKDYFEATDDDDVSPTSDTEDSVPLQPKSTSTKHHKPRDPPSKSRSHKRKRSPTENHGYKSYIGSVYKKRTESDSAIRQSTWFTNAMYLMGPVCIKLIRALSTITI